MMVLNDLKLQSYKRDHSAELVSKSEQRLVYVSSEVLRRAFITRAWLDRTLLNSVMGKYFICAEVEPKGQKLEASRVWLSIEANILNVSKKEFKNFGLELHKPKLNDQKNGSKLFGIQDLNKPINKLSERFAPNKNDLFNFRFDNDFLEKLDKRQLYIAKTLSSDRLIEILFTPEWRLVIGMGEASVYETNLILHHTYGIPYVPASTFKGVLRHYAFELVKDGQLDQDTFEFIFGENDQFSSTKKPFRGHAIFFDAFPIKAPRIELDVMTPHYPDYYSKGKPPADWQSPNPVNFLTIGRGTSFRFLIGLPQKGKSKKIEQQLSVWLEAAFSERGIGAKTSVGYGSLKVIPKSNA